MSTGPVPTLAEVEAQIAELRTHVLRMTAAELAGQERDLWETYARQLAGRPRAIHRTARNLRDGYPPGSPTRNALTLVLEVIESELVDGEAGS